MARLSKTHRKPEGLDVRDNMYHRCNAWGVSIKFFDKLGDEKLFF